MEVANLVAKFSAEGEQSVMRALGNVDRGVMNVADNSVRAGRGLGTVFQVAGGFLGAQLVNFGFNAAKGLVDMQAEAETAKVSLEAVTGSAEEADKTFSFVQKLAAETPFEFPELLDSAIQLEAFGTNAEDWLVTIGDTAAATGKSVDQVTQAVLDAQTGEFERLKELGIKVRTEGDKLYFRMKKNGEWVEEAVDKNNADMIESTVKAIWNDKYAGAMEKQSKTFAGQMSTLKDNIALTMQNATASVFQFATRGLAFVNDIFADGFVATIEDRFGPGAAAFVKDIGTMAGAVVDAFGEGAPVSELVKKLPEDWQPLGEQVLLAADAFGQLWTNIKQGDWEGAANDIKQLADAGLQIGKIVLTGAFELAGDLAEGAWAYIERWAMGSVVSGDGTGGPDTDRQFSVGEVLVTGIVKLMGDLNDIGGAIARELGLISTGPEIEEAREAGRKAGKSFADAIVNGVIAGGESAKSSGDGSGGGQGLFSTLVANLLDFGQFAPMGQLSSEQNTLMDQFYQWAVGLGEGIGEQIRSGIGDGIASGGLAVLMLAVQGLDIIGGLWGGMKAKWDGTVVPGLQGFVAFILTTFFNTITWLLQPGIDLLTGLWSGAKGVYDGSFVPLIQSIVTKVLTTFSGTIDWLYSAGSNLVQGLTNGIDVALGPLDEAVGKVLDIINKIPIDLIIKSPSRVAIGWGENIVGGLTKGISGALPDLTRSMGDVTGALGIGSPRLGMSARGSAGGGVVNINLAGAYIGRGAEQEIRGMIERYGAGVMDRRVNAANLAGARR